MSKTRDKELEYSHTHEKIPFKDDFPLHAFYYDVYEDPLNELHSHDAVEIGVCLKGNGIFVLDQYVHTYQEGDVFVIGTQTYHRGRSSSRDNDLWAFIYYNPSDWNLSSLPESIKLITNRVQYPALFNSAKHLSRELVIRLPEYRLLCKGLLFSIHALVCRALHSDNSFADAVSSYAKFDKRIKRALDIMISSSEKDISIRELAASCDLSESHFRQLFKQRMGTTPKQYQTQLKIKRAMNLLRTDSKKIIDIAYECGFSSISSFNRQFRSETGYSPQAWRQKQR